MATYTFLTPSGFHTPGATDKHVVVVYAETDPTPAPSGPGGVVRVDFSITPLGGATTIVQVTDIAPWEQKFDAPSPNPGATTGKMSFIPGWGVELDAADWPAGQVSVTATAVMADGTTGTVKGGPVIWYNGKGTEIRPNTKTIHVDLTGSDTTGTGTALNPVRTPARALQLLANVPGGASASDREVGGGEIHVHGAGFHSWFGSYQGSNPQVHTSGHWHFKIICDDNVIIDNSQFLFVKTQPGESFRMTIIGGIVLDGDLVVDIDNSLGQETEVWVWAQNMLVVGSLWNPAGRRWSVLFLGTTSPLFNFNGHLTHGHKIATGCGMLGTTSGWTNTWHLLLDCFVYDFLGISFMTPATLDSNFIPRVVNCRGYQQRKFQDVRGSLETFVGGKATVSVVASGPHTGKMRVDLTADCFVSQFGNPATSGTLQDLATLAELVGQGATWRVRVRGMPNAAWNNTTAVLEAGTNGSGRTYCILDHVISSGGTVGAGSAQMSTFYVPQGQSWDEYLHGDFFHTLEDHPNGLLFWRNAGWDFESAQGIFTSGSALVDAAIVDNFITGNDTHNNPMGGGTKTRCIIAGNTFGSYLQNSSNSATGSVFVDNVAADGNGYPASAKLIAYNHCENPSAPPGGTLGATGTWFESEILSGPTWDPTPTLAAASTGIASPYRRHLNVDRWTGVRAYTRGCPRSVGLRNYAISSSPLPVVDVGAPPATIALAAPLADSVNGGLAVAVPPSTVALAVPGAVVLVPKIDVAAPPATIAMAVPSADSIVGAITETAAPPATISLAVPSATSDAGVGETAAPPETIALAVPSATGSKGAGQSIAAPPPPIVSRAPTATSSVGVVTPTAPTTGSGGGGRRNVPLSQLSAILAALGGGLAGRRRRRAR